jgi:hypothetical protein
MRILLDTFIYDPEIWDVVIIISILLVPAAILWGLAQSCIYSFKINLILKSLSIGLAFTALLVLNRIIEGAYWIPGYHFDPLGQLMDEVGFFAALLFATLLSASISLLVLKRTRFRNHHGIHRGRHI